MSPENLKWDCVYWLWRECRKKVCWVLFRKTELLFLSPENLKCTAWNTGQKKSEKSPQNMFRTWLNTLANDFGPFWIFEIFWRLDPPWNTGQKFVGKNCPKTCSKHVCTLLGMFWAFLEFSKFFDFFLIFSKARPSMEHGAFFFKKIATKHVQKKFAQFSVRSWAFLQFWIFLIFSKTFDESMEHWAKKFFQKNCTKTRLDTRERFWTFLELWTFFDFFHELFLSLYLKK